MCGIIAGRVKELKDNGGCTDHFSHLLHRGADSWGFLHYNIATRRWNLEKSLSKRVVMDKIAKLDGCDYIIAHNRAKSIGGNTLSLAHPIRTDNVAVIHNGTNTDIYDGIATSGSDTEAISFLQANAKNFTTTFDNIGDVGIVFTVDFDKKGEVHLHKDKIRPLVIHKGTDIIASEPLFDGEWANIEIQDILTLAPIKSSNIVISKYTSVKPMIVKKCPSCSKKHYHTNGNLICDVCSIKGIAYTPPVRTDPYNAYHHNDSRYDAYDQYDNYGHYYSSKPKKVGKSSFNSIEDVLDTIETGLEYVGGYIHTLKGSLMSVVVFDAHTAREKWKILYNTPFPVINYTPKMTKAIKLTIPKRGAVRTYVLNPISDNLATIEVTGYVVKDRLSDIFYVIEDDGKYAATYHCYYKDEPKARDVETYVYPADNFNSYKVTEDISPTATTVPKVEDVYDFVNTYLVEIDTFYECVPDSSKDVLITKNEEILVPEAYTWH